MYPRLAEHFIYFILLPGWGLVSATWRCRKARVTAQAPSSCHISVPPTCLARHRVSGYHGTSRWSHPIKINANKCKCQPRGIPSCAQVPCLAALWGNPRPGFGFGNTPKRPGMRTGLAHLAWCLCLLQAGFHCSHGCHQKLLTLVRVSKNQETDECKRSQNLTPKSCLDAMIHGGRVWKAQKVRNPSFSPRQ